MIGFRKDLNMVYLIIIWGKNGHAGVTLTKVTNWTECIETLKTLMPMITVSGLLSLIVLFIITKS